MMQDVSLLHVTAQPRAPTMRATQHCSSGIRKFVCLKIFAWAARGAAARITELSIAIRWQVWQRDINDTMNTVGASMDVVRPHYSSTGFNQF